MKIVLIIFIAVIAFMAVSAVAGSLAFKRRVAAEVGDLFQSIRSGERQVITEEDLQSLPEPVQRYLKQAQIIGRERIRTVRLKQKGFFRTRPDQKWIPMKADEYFTLDPPAFIWLGRIASAPLISVSARDKYARAKGNMLIKLASIFTLADATGPDMDEASLMRYLDEMIWFPTAYLDGRLQWEALDDNSARAVITDRGLTGSADFYFNEKGELIDFRAERFCSYTNQKELWSTPVFEYREIGGFRIPTKGEGVWKLKSGDFSYIRLEITEIEYDVTGPY